MLVLIKHDRTFIIPPSAVFQVEKLNTQIAALRETLANKDNETADSIRTKLNELQQSSLKLFEMAYKKVWT